MRSSVLILGINGLFAAALVVSSPATAIAVGQTQAPAETSTPAGPARTNSSYVLGPEDEFTVKAFEAEELSGTAYRVDSSGNVRLPMVGTIHATGLTVADLEQEVTKRLRSFIKTPSVSIRLTEVRSRPVSVLGAVKKPGIQQLQGESTLVEMLSLAGGLDENAGTMIKITRRIAWGAIPLPSAKTDPTGQFSIAEVPVKTIMNARSPESNIVVRPNDVITVPRGELVYVIGEVHRAGGFPLHEHEQFSVLQALSLAEGMKNTASPKNAKILRVDASSPNRKEIDVNLHNVLTGKQSDLMMQPDDILFIPNNLTRSATIRSLEAAIQIGTGVVIWRR